MWSFESLQQLAICMQQTPAELPINSALLMTKKTAMGELSHALPVQSELSAHNLNASPIQYACPDSKS
ncbi:hypothetical protein ACOMHN_040538 [Nucella lapillus]